MTWFRLGAIGAMLLGSLYVLAPTALQGDIESQRAAAAAAVDTSSSQSSADLFVELTGPDPASAVPVVDARLRAAGTKFERVQEKDGEVVVSLKPGTDRKSVVKIATAPGKRALYAADAIAPLPEPLPPVPETAPGDPDLFVALAGTGDARGHWAGVAEHWALGAVPAGVAPLPVQVTAFDGKNLTTSAPLPEGTSFAVVAVDGRMVGLALPGSDTLAWVPLRKDVNGDRVADVDAVALLKGGTLPGPLTAVAETVKVDEKKDVVVAEPLVPPSVLAMLPDTVINLGLDLQGGLDLTLQVELDDAVMSQVARDAVAMREAAEKEKVAFTSIRKDKFEPMIWFEGASQDEIAKFITGRFSGYRIGVEEPTRFSYRMIDSRVEDVKKQAVEQVLETLRKRVDATGVKEPSIVKKSNGRINVQLPGAVDLQQAVDAIGTTALLEFRMVDPKQDQANIRDILSRAEDALPPDQWKDDRVVNDWLWETKHLTEDRVILWHYEEVPGEGMKRIDYSVDGKEGPLLLINEVPLTGNDVNDATVGFDQNNMPYVALSFKPRGSQVFCDLTTAHVKERFAIILDNQIRSAPSIRERICGGRASIDMGSSMDALQDANTLALVLRTGSLDAPVSIGEVRQVGASLGHDAINAGGIASAVGFVIVLVFMGLWYRRAGMIANVALALNVLLVVASLALFGATLTLPGIAGIALTVGMAVDANIIIFERIREELALGVQPRKAVDTGFDKGLVAVLDANITTGIAGIVLYSYGTGPIKGFAVTLLIGILTTLVTALFVTRTLMELVTRSSSARITI
ncbi:MAG: protein translocase subunit SecD [Alphaproteobacteria bacterium]|nr:protein translocase subunit SecD [Alphaproteobacteria bacterium]